MKHTSRAGRGFRLISLSWVTCLIAISCASKPETPWIAVKVSPFPDNSRILFQGDSITDGNRGRNQDPNHILGHGYAFVIAAKYGSEFPQSHLMFMNRGVSGNTVTALAGRWRTDTLDLKPDILSILIGVNDVDRFVRSGTPTSEEFERDFDALIEQTIAAMPNVKLVFCEPFILPVGRIGQNWDAWHAAMVDRQAIVKRLAEKHHAIFVPLQKVFDDACTRAPADYWIWDGIHPTYSGHQLLADAWVKAVMNQ